MTTGSQESLVAATAYELRGLAFLAVECLYEIHFPAEKRTLFGEGYIVGKDFADRPAYKYIPRVWGRKMRQDGNMVISQWSYYKDEEKHGIHIGDQNEGVFESSMTFDYVSRNEDLNRNEQDFLRHADVRIESSVGCGVHGVKFAAEDLYIYCLSDVLSGTLARQFCNHEDPSIIFIPNLWHMFRAISNAITEYATPLAIGKVMYVDREYNFRRFGKINPAIVKNSKYDDQSEIRMLWRPTSNDTDRLSVTSSAIASACWDIQFYDFNPPESVIYCVVLGEMPGVGQSRCRAC